MQQNKQPNIKLIGINGQISLGKKNAGKMVSIELVDDDIWIIKAGKFVSEFPTWIYENNGIQRIKKALDWAKNNPPIDNFDEIVKKL
jgi:hypothetical protein